MAGETEEDEAHVIGVAAGSSHSAALLDCGTVLTWGRGEDGQLGHGDSNELTQPKAVHALLGKGVTSVYCGAEFTVAVSPTGLFSWGWGDFGRLGHGDTADVFVPRPIAYFYNAPGRRAVHVACGDTHTLVVTEAGELYAFGRNQNGQLGLGHTDDMFSPQLVEALQGQQVVHVAAGAEHTIAATSDGQVWGWGWGRYGNLGNGLLEDRYMPTPTAGLAGGARAVQVRCGWRHSIAVSDTGQIYTFGWSKYGQLGHGDNEDRLVPTLVTALQDKVVACVAGGWRHTVAADNQGTLYAWGWNKFGQLGLGDLEDRNAPTPITSSPLAGQHTRLLACGWRHTLAVSEEGQMFTWGRGTNGQLGHGSEDDRSAPTELTCLSKGTLSRAAMVATASPAGGYVLPEDRYAVVPGSGGNVYDGAMVPDVCPPPGTQGNVKKQRT